jgi:hypothetical protein
MAVFAAKMPQTLRLHKEWAWADQRGISPAGFWELKV